MVVGLAYEARALERRLEKAARAGAPPRRLLTVHLVGMGAADLARLDRELRGAAPVALVATGLAGGCAPAARPGDLVLGETVGPGSAGEWLAPDARLLALAGAACRALGLPCHTGRLLTAPGAATTPAAKAALWRDHRALAVDLESAPVLAWAAARGLPAVAVRAVADGPDEALPAPLAGAVDGRGRLRVGALAGALLRPRVLLAAARLGRRAGLAFDRVAALLAALAAAPVAP